jgi:thioredoxin 1
MVPILFVKCAVLPPVPWMKGSRRKPHERARPTRGNSSMILRRTLLCAAIAISATAAFAQTVGVPKLKFTQAAFEAAQAAGKPVLVEVTAPWCPTCKAQAPILKSLLDRPEFKGMAVFEVDFDSQKDALATLRVQRQSTILTYRGKTEISRTVGETKADAIEKQLRDAI